MPKPAHFKKKRSRPITTALLFVLALLVLAGGLFVKIENIHFEPVLTGSMRPTANPGDLAILEPMPTKNIKVGDVIVYVPPGKSEMVMHRVHAMGPKGILTKGDANNVTDPWGWVHIKGQTTYHLVHVVRYLGWAMKEKAVSLMILGGLLILIVVASVIGELRKPKGAVLGKPQTV